MSKTPQALLHGAAVAALLMGSAAAQARDPLADGFRDPPASARPRTWWHWLNGNITIDGIDKDLAWMKRVGLGGVTNFDASLGTPQIVAERLAYMTPAWKQAFAHATATAQRLGLEFTIASSPGWSETGGPWIAPADGMKKLVWSTTEIAGGRRFTGRLAAPPTVTGPYGTSPYTDALAAVAGAGHVAQSASGAVAVLTYPLASGSGDARATITTGTGAALDGASLIDADERTTAAIPLIGKDDPALVAAFAMPRTIRTATLFVPNAVPPFGAPKFRPVLEAESASGWREIALLPLGNVPTTVAFAPVAATRFRVRFAPNPDPGATLAPPAPGANVIGVFPDRATTDLPVATFVLSDDARVNRFEAKAGFATVPDYYALTSTADDAGVIDPTHVVDLTAKVRADGTIDWTPPAGRWRVLCFGWSLLGTTNHPAAPEATGLEVDKYDAAAVRRYLDAYLATYGLKDGARAGVNALLTDSIEAGDANWTPAMVAQFRRLRGYDPTPWLPALAGVVIGSRARSDAFLYDYRRTLADLLASEHYGTIARVAKANGLALYGEALEDKRPQLGDDLAMRRHTSVPMAAMWAFGDEGPRPTLMGDILGAASVAHVYGQNLVAAESFTSAFSPWAQGPAELKRVADLEFALGVNRPVIHTSPHSPPDDKLPGLSLAIFGQAFDRHETWADMARPWIDYLARTGFALQQGRHVADIAYFTGEEAPLTQLYADGRVTQLPVRNGFDFVSADALAGDLRVEDGRIVSQGGASYRALFLGGTSSRMTLPTLRRIAALADSGATVIGMAPVGDPSLADDPAAFRALIARLWPANGQATIGRGRVIASGDLAAGLARAGISPDFLAQGASDASSILFQHRALADGSDLYFVHNRGAAAQAITARFAVAGRHAEQWHAENGTAEALPTTSGTADTAVPMSLAAHGSAIIVLRSATAPRAADTIDYAHPVATLGGWQVAFEPGRGAPATLAMPTLAPLNEASAAGVRYFSGVVTYTTRFTLTAADAARSLALDLGKVGDIAEVRVNGALVGTAWHAPYRVPLGGAARAGTNTLEVRVANLWANRLIGDAQPGAAKITFVAAPTYRPDAPLRPAGLIGPVRVLGAAR